MGEDRGPHISQRRFDPLASTSVSDGSPRGVDLGPDSLPEEEARVKSRGRRALIVVASAIVLLSPLAAPGTSSADPGGGASAPAASNRKMPAPQPGNFPSIASLKSGSSQGGGATPALTYNCYGQTDQPHLSTHVPGTVNVTARTVCSGHVVYVTTNLYRSRWYGWELRGSDNTTGVGTATDNAAENNCGGTHDYLATSYHENLDDGSYANTSNTSNGSLTC